MAKDENVAESAADKARNLNEFFIFVVLLHKYNHISTFISKFVQRNRHIIKNIIMKTIKTLIIALAASLFCAGANAATLNLQNGIAAGKALYDLYGQYKATGKLDLSNTTNINNVVSLVNNIKGLTTKSTSENTSESFLSGLISGSKELINSSNSDSILSKLGSIANLDVSSLATQAASSAATSAVNKLLGKVTGKSSSTSTDNTAASTATSVLTSLFSSLKK